ncbi:hypothetical protein HDU97_009683 [Phlyctochytrium planicorne]|nr:hypothetical protein HDU97_009683 [Phlyctochytrium planicorne]
MDAIKAVKAIAGNKSLQSVVVNAAVRGATSAVRSTALAIEAPPPRADIFIKTASKEVVLSAFYPKVSDVVNDISYEDKFLSGSVTLKLNQDFDKALEVYVELEGKLDVKTDDLARAWTGIGSVGSLALSGGISVPISRPVFKARVSAWKASEPVPDTKTGLSAGEHTFDFLLPISSLCPASTDSFSFNITYTLTAGLVCKRASETNPTHIFNSTSLPIKIRRVRDPSQKLGLEASTEGTSVDGLVEFKASSAAEVLKDEKKIRVAVTLTLGDGVEVVREFSGVFKQATRFMIDVRTEDQVEREIKILKALILQRFKVSPRVVLDLGAHFNQRASIDTGVRSTARSESTFGRLLRRTRSFSRKSDRSLSVSKSLPATTTTTTQDDTTSASTSKSDASRKREQPNERKKPIVTKADQEDQAGNAADIYDQDTKDDEIEEVLQSDQFTQEVNFDPTTRTFFVTFEMPLPASAMNVAKGQHTLHPDVRLRELRRTHHILFELKYRASLTSAKNVKETKKSNSFAAAASAAVDLDMKKKKEPAARRFFNPERFLDFAIPVVFVDQ